MHLRSPLRRCRFKLPDYHRAEVSLLRAREPGESLAPETAIAVPLGKVLRQPVRADVGRPGKRAAFPVMANGQKRTLPFVRTRREQKRRAGLEAGLVVAEE